MPLSLPLIATVIATALTLPAAAQSTQPASSAAARKASVGPEVPTLTASVSGRRNELAEAGVRSILARPGKRSVEVRTVSGTSYVRWPKDSAPISFEVAVGPDGAYVVRASDFTEAKQGLYQSTIDAMITKAVALGRGEKARARKPGD